MDAIEVRRLKVILLVSSLASLFFLMRAAYQENLSGTWKGHQEDYRALSMAHATDDTTRHAAEAMTPAIHQIFLPGLDRVDRCTTCHTGIDDPRMVDAPQPLRTHGGELLAHHPADRFGCTVCHDGQGRALDKAAAHGDVAHWPHPLLSGARAYTTCSRCHYEIDLFGAEEDLFAEKAQSRPLWHSELASSLPGDLPPAARAIERGKRLVLQSGCLGCHSYRGRGGTLGPEITYVGDKIPHDFDFTHIDGEHTVEQWLLEHFKDPSRVSPGTLMPDLELTDPQAHDLTIYLLSLHRKSMPAAYTPVPSRHSDEPASGLELYGIFCSACHGSDGQGSTVRERDTLRPIDAPPALMVPSINHPDTLAVASDAYLTSIVRGGRPGTNMPAWTGPGGGGLRSEEIDRIVTAIRSRQAPGPDMNAISSAQGNVHYGETIYLNNCAGCHGRNGEGAIGVSLRSPSFLSVASDEFLAQTIVEGRPDTAMPSWREFDSRQVSDLLAFLRSWQPLRSGRGEVLGFLAGDGDTEGSMAGASVRVGAILYRANCVTCHGPDGMGDLGPSIATQEFLTVVSDDYLYQTIAQGRPGTGMPAWRHLSSADAASLIAFLRTWQTEPARPLEPVRVRGDWDTGEILYQGACAGCHGPAAEGGVGPQLNNPRFLAQAGDAMLRHWILDGKTGTPMRGFRKGGQGTAELSDRQIDDIVAYLRALERRPRVSVAKRPSGRPELGRYWYAASCAPCHGLQGEGVSGPALANRGFLRAASDGFLMATMALGRDGTEMRPVKRGAQSILRLSSDQINDLVAYLRSWEYRQPQADIAHRFVVPWDLQHGKRLYRSNCSGCHGLNGKGELSEPGQLSAWAPNLNNTGFLAAASDGFLQATIVRGRAGTAMRPFGRGRQGLVELSPDDIDDIVAYIRRWSQQPGMPITIPALIGVKTSQGGGQGVPAVRLASAPSSETTNRVMPRNKGD